MIPITAVPGSSVPRTPYKYVVCDAAAALHCGTYPCACCFELPLQNTAVTAATAVTSSVTAAEMVRKKQEFLDQASAFLSLLCCLCCCSPSVLVLMRVYQYFVRFVPCLHVSLLLFACPAPRPSPSQPTTPTSHTAETVAAMSSAKFPSLIPMTLIWNSHG